MAPAFEKLTMALALGIHARPEGRILSPSKERPEPVEGAS